MPTRMHTSKLFIPRMVDLFNGLLFHIPICCKLGIKLFKSLTRGTWTWIIMLVRLLIFTAVLLPGWIGMVKYWLFSPNIIRNVEYGQGARKRNLLDVYLPAESLVEKGEIPVVVFVTGGAWIIGYKLWCALIGRGLSSLGVLTIVPDYRNFPQGDIEDMVTDVIAAVSWTSKNVHIYGGDPQKIVLAGQSAGAHICMCALVEALRAKVAAQELSNSPAIIDTKPAKKEKSGVWEKLISPVKSLTGRSALFDNSSPIQEFFTGKRNLNKVFKSVTANQGGADQTLEADLQAEEDEEDEDGLDGDLTWKSSSHPLKKNDVSPNRTIQKLPVPDSQKPEIIGTSPARNSSIFAGLESPRKMQEIPILIGTVLKSAGMDLKNGVSSVLKELRDKVQTVAEDLEQESVELKCPTERSADSAVLDLSDVKLFIGISGPYNLLSLSSHMQSRGLDHSILKWICRGEVNKYSPVLQLDAVMSEVLSTHAPSPGKSDAVRNENTAFSVKNGFSINPIPVPISIQNSDPLHVFTEDKKLSLKIPEIATTTTAEDMTPLKNTDFPSGSERSAGSLESSLSGADNPSDRLTLTRLGFPPAALFHGAEDSSVPSSVSVEMAATICRWGGEVFLRMYEGWAHTDPILEGPLTGDNTLCEDIVLQIKRTFPTALSSSNPSSVASSPIRNVSSVSTDDMFKCAFVEKNAPNPKKNSLRSVSSSGRTDGAGGREGLPVGVGNVKDDMTSLSTMCPRCTLQVGLNNNKQSNYIDPNSQKGCGTNINGVKRVKQDRDEGDAEITVSEHFPSKCNVRRAVAQASAVDRVCRGEVLVPQIHIGGLCDCANSAQGVLLEGRRGKSSGEGVGMGMGMEVKKDDFLDCRVPRVLVCVARFVNPF